LIDSVLEQKKQD